MKLDNSKIETISSTTSTAYTTLENQLYDVNKALTVLTKSLNFKGKGADAHKGFMEVNSLNATYVLLQIGKDIQIYVNKIKSGFLEFESDSAGKVSSERVSTVQSELKKISSNVSDHITSLESNEKKAAEYITVESTKTSTLTKKFSDLDSKLTKVNDDFLAKDTELAKGASVILESIDRLSQMLSQIKGNYVTASGKYDQAKFFNITKEPWYVKGDISVFSDKQIKDPYSYDTAYFSLGQAQLVGGWDKEGYAYSNLLALTGSGTRETNNGVTRISGNFDFASGDLQLKSGPWLNMKGGFKLGHVDSELLYGNGIHLQANAEAARLESRISTLDDHVFLESRLKGPSANVDLSLYSTDEKSELGVELGASTSEAAVDFGFDLFKYSVTDAEGNNVGKSLLAANIEPQIKGGGSAVAKITDEVAYDSVLGNKDWDVKTLSVRVGATMIAGGEVDITIPYVWPDGWFK